MITEAKKEGIDEVTKTDDSLTYKMSKSKHKEMIKGMKEGLLDYVDELKSNEEYASIKDVTYDKSFEEFTLVLDREEFENSFAALGLGMSGMYYQLFNGTDMEKARITVHLKDDATGEVYDSIVYPDAFDEE